MLAVWVILFTVFPVGSGQGESASRRISRLKPRMMSRLQRESVFPFMLFRFNGYMLMKIREVITDRDLPLFDDTKVFQVWRLFLTQKQSDFNIVYRWSFLLLFFIFTRNALI